MNTFFFKENTSFSYFLQIWVIVIPLEWIWNIASLFFKKTRLGRQNKTCLLTKMHLNYHEAKNPTLEFYKSGISTLESNVLFWFWNLFLLCFWIFRILIWYTMYLTFWVYSWDNYFLTNSLCLFSGQNSDFRSLLPFCSLCTVPRNLWTGMCLIIHRGHRRMSYWVSL